MVSGPQKIQDVKAMRTHAVLLLSLMLGGCAATAGQERVVVAVDAPPQSTSEQVQITESIPQIDGRAAPEAAPPVRRRLSQTVTLGQGAPEGYAPGPAAAPQAAGGPNVIVNNNVTVVNSPPIFYGGYGGYGGYGYGRGGGGAGAYSGRGSDGRAVAGTGSHQAWAPSGWEGAGRTAAPGRTPNVGGNFAPPPNSGPAPMK